MASETDNSIEALLEQRARFEQWLAKLDSTADKAPPAVRQKVRADYEVRLRGVIERPARPRRHHRGRAAPAPGRPGRPRRPAPHAEEELAEAEVRHTVGEFGDDEWRRISEESDGRLNGLREQLKTVGKEIARLVEVQALISAPARAGRATAAAAGRGRDRALAAPARPAASRRARGGGPRAPARRSAPAATVTARSPSTPAQVDELAFLKSVADEEVEARAAPRRPSNPGRSGPRAPAPWRPPRRRRPPGGKAGAPGVAKTLKCGECGTLNRPTEWYCERCGAELAGV